MECNKSSCCPFTSTVGRKVLMSLTGMSMAIFLLVHVAGNLTILASHEKFNDYAHLLTGNKIILYGAEASLITILLLHIWMAVRLTYRNQAARPIPYEVSKNTGRSRRWWGSSNMMITGSAVFIFIIYHLLHFKFGADYVTSTKDGSPIRDLARLVVEEFHKPIEVSIYVVAMLVIGMHLWHGFRSFFDTMGLNDSKRDKFFKLLSAVFVAAVIGGFIAIPLCIFLGRTPV